MSDNLDPPGDDRRRQIPGVLSTPPLTPRRSQRIANRNANSNNHIQVRINERNVNENHQFNDRNDPNQQINNEIENNLINDESDDESNVSHQPNASDHDNHTDDDEHEIEDEPMPNQRQIQQPDRNQQIPNHFQILIDTLTQQNRLLSNQLAQIQIQQDKLTEQIKDQQKELSEKIESDARSTILPGLTADELITLRNEESVSIYNALSKPEKPITENCQNASVYHKILMKQQFPLTTKTDIIDYLLKYDLFCDQIGANSWDNERNEIYLAGVPAMVRHFYITNYYLSDKIKERFFQARDENEPVNTYDGLKTWLYKQQKGKMNIEKRKNEILNWKYDHTTLLEAINDFTAKIRRYVKEIKFAKAHGISENEIIKLNEKQLFLHFMNAISNEERKYLHSAFQTIGGDYNITKLKLLCKSVDKQLRPGLGIKPLIKSNKTHEIHAIATDQPKCNCDHQSNHHSDEEQAEICALRYQPRYNRYRQNRFRQKRWRNNNRYNNRFRPRKWCRICRTSTHWTSQCRRNN